MSSPAVKSPEWAMADFACIVRSAVFQYVLLENRLLSIKHRQFIVDKIQVGVCIIVIPASHDFAKAKSSLSRNPGELKNENLDSG